MADLPGQSIGRYYIIEKLGEGGMATVYRAHDTRLDRDVAIKFIRTDMFPPALLQTVLQRFEREAKALAHMDHPNIVHVYDFGEYQGVPYLVMEYLPGGTLRQRMGKPVPYQEAVAVLTPIASALEYAHNENVVHRDVKPANILFTSKGMPKLSDFGIAKLLGVDETTNLTGTGMGMGTPAYMAPEQWKGKTSPSVDVYALGVIFYELITGRLPYQADTPGELFEKVITQPLPDARRFAANLPQAVLEMLKTALAKTPGTRYTDMAEIVAALESLTNDSPYLLIEQSAELQDLETLALPIVEIPTQTTPEKLQPTPPPIVVPQVESLTDSKSGHLSLGMWLIGVGVLLVLVTFITYLGGMAKQVPNPPRIITKTQTATNRFTLTSIPNSLRQTALTLNPANTPAPPTLIPTRVSEQDGMVQAFIPAGSFRMGSNIDNEQPVHNFSLDAFWMDTTEVSIKMYALCVQAGVCQPPSNGSSNTRSSYFGNPEFDDYPVIFVSWHDALAYCTWAGRELPTEAQWEYAAQGGSDFTIYPWGVDAPVCNLKAYNGAQFKECSVRDTVPVASFGANGYGLYDMAGNVWEWASSMYKPYPYNAFDGREDLSIEGDRVIRSGSWDYSNGRLRPESRASEPSNMSSSQVGFRCAASP